VFSSPYQIYVKPLSQNGEVFLYRITMMGYETLLKCEGLFPRILKGKIKRKWFAGGSDEYYKRLVISLRYLL